MHRPSFGLMEYAGATGVAVGLRAHVTAFVAGYANDIRARRQVSVAARGKNIRVLPEADDDQDPEVVDALEATTLLMGSRDDDAAA